MLNISPPDYTSIIEHLLTTHYGVDLADTELGDNDLVCSSIEINERPFELVNQWVEKNDINRISFPASCNCFVVSDNAITATEEAAAIRATNITVKF